MTMTPVEIFRAMCGDGIPNVKECEGLIIRPVAYHTHTYEDQDGKEHAVLVLKDGKIVHEASTDGLTEKEILDHMM